MPSRRELLRSAQRWLVLGAAWALSAPWLAGCRRRATPAAGGPFLPEEERILGAALAQLLPGGAGLPDAGAARVADYLRRELGRPELVHLRRRLRRGLGELQAEARREGAPFHALSAEAQRGLLSRFQEGRAGTPGFQSDAFFEILLTLALEGYLGSPAQGGNAGGVVWRALGIDGHGAHGAHRAGP